MEQLRRNREFIVDSRFTPNALHRRAIAPTDGLAGSVALARSMMDVSWLEGARAVRWQGSHQKVSAHGALPRTPLAAILVLEWRRVYRRPDAAGRFVWSLTTSWVLALVLDVHQGSVLVAAATAYFAGTVMSSGLKQISASKALQAALGRSTRALVACHGVIPFVAIFFACTVNAALWHTTPIQTAILIFGVTTAVLLRATTSELPHHAMIFTDPFFGVAFQPAMLVAMIRGPLTVAITAAIATSI